MEAGFNGIRSNHPVETFDEKVRGDTKRCNWKFIGPFRTSSCIVVGKCKCWNFEKDSLPEYRP